MARIVFFTEMNFTGKINRNHYNSRTEFAWMITLDADHYRLDKLPTTRYDLGIVIIPKNKSSLDINIYKQYCSKVAVMQEGPNNYWQDYTLNEQITYLNNLIDSDMILCHNEVDVKYYKGLINHKNVQKMPTLMIEDTVASLPTLERRDVILGGTFTGWYGGFDSYQVAQEFGDMIVPHVPSMGRFTQGEEVYVNKLPYMDWTNWIRQLNKYKYAVHLNRNALAGTFALNCAFLGIPCIGYEHQDTQRLCFPNTTVKMGDLVHAREIARNLKNDKEYYTVISNIAKEYYNRFFSEKVFLSNWENIYQSLFV